MENDEPWPGPLAVRAQRPTVSLDESLDGQTQAKSAVFATRGDIALLEAPAQSATSAHARGNVNRGQPAASGRVMDFAPSWISPALPL